MNKIASSDFTVDNAEFSKPVDAISPATPKNSVVANLMKAWESKLTQRTAKGAGFTLMAVSLAACNDDDVVAVVDAPVVDAPVVDEPVVVAPTPTLSALQQAALDFGVAITVAGDAVDVVDLKAGADATVLSLNGATRAITNDFDAEVAAGVAFGITAIVLDGVLGNDALILDGLRAINDNLDDTIDGIAALGDEGLQLADIATAAGDRDDRGLLSSLWNDASYALTPGNAAARRDITEFLEEYEATIGFRQLAAERALDTAIDAFGDDLTNDQEDAVAAIVDAGAFVGAAAVNMDLNIVADEDDATTVETAAGILTAARGVNAILVGMNADYAEAFEGLEEANDINAVLNVIGAAIAESNGTTVNDLNGQLVAIDDLEELLEEVVVALAAAAVAADVAEGVDAGPLDGILAPALFADGVVFALGGENDINGLFAAAADQAALETAVEAFSGVFELLQERAEANMAVETAFDTLDLVARAENGDVEFINLFNDRTATEADDIFIYAPAIMGSRTINDFAEDGIDTIVFVGEYKFVELEDGAATNFNAGVGSASDLEIFYYVTTGGNTVLLVEDQAFLGSVENRGNNMSQITLVDYDASAAIEAAFTAGGATILSSEVAVV